MGDGEFFIRAWGESSLKNSSKWGLDRWCSVQSGDTLLESFSKGITSSDPLLISQNGKHLQNWC